MFNHLHYNGTLSHLDLAICTSSNSLNFECNVFTDNWGSDHYPLEIVFAQGVSNTELKLKNCFNFKKADWTNFQNSLQNENLFKQDIKDIQKDYDKFVSLILATRDQCIPKRINKFNHKYSPFWNKECSDAKVIKKQPKKN